jgi:hypothetical protein
MSFNETMGEEGGGGKGLLIHLPRYMDPLAYTSMSKRPFPAHATTSPGTERMCVCTPEKEMNRAYPASVRATIPRCVSAKPLTFSPAPRCMVHSALLAQLSMGL